MRNASPSPGARSHQPNGIDLVLAKEITEPCTEDSPDSCFAPFIHDRLVSLMGALSDQHPVRFLRDTGGSLFVILSGILPFSDRSACGYSTVLRGIKMGYIPRPLHKVLQFNPHCQFRGWLC